MVQVLVVGLVATSNMYGYCFGGSNADALNELAESIGSPFEYQGKLVQKKQDLKTHKLIYKLKYEEQINWKNNYLYPRQKKPILMQQ